MTAAAPSIAVPPMIEVENLSISFGLGADRVDAVKNVSFTVAPGESYGLVGESGSGKSTILRALAGLNPYLDRPHGDLAGHQLAAKRPRAQRRLVQMVFQDPYGSLHPKHTVDRILSEPLDRPRLRRYRDAGARARSTASAWVRRSASAIRINCRAGSASASRSRAP